MFTHFKNQPLHVQCEGGQMGDLGPHIKVVLKVEEEREGLRSFS